MTRHVGAAAEALLVLIHCEVSSRRAVRLRGGGWCQPAWPDRRGCLRDRQGLGPHCDHAGTAVRSRTARASACAGLSWIGLGVDHSAAPPIAQRRTASGDVRVRVAATASEVRSQPTGPLRRGQRGRVGETYCALHDADFRGERCSGGRGWHGRRAAKGSVAHRVSRQWTGTAWRQSWLFPSGRAADPPLGRDHGLWSHQMASRYSLMASPT
jgi:hypothetical protein